MSHIVYMSRQLRPKRDEVAFGTDEPWVLPHMGNKPNDSGYEPNVIHTKPGVEERVRGDFAVLLMRIRFWWAQRGKGSF